MKLKNRISWLRYYVIYVILPKIDMFYLTKIEPILSCLLGVSSTRIRRKLQQPSKLSVLEANYYHVVVAQCNPFMRVWYWHVLRNINNTTWMENKIKEVLACSMVVVLRF